MNTPNPALVTERAAQRLPRLALLLFCAVYLLPGLFGRDPWRNADITAFGYMANMAHGHNPLLAPTLGGLASDGALLPYWFGAAAIHLLGPWVGEPLAARLAFALLLGLSLLLTWYSCFHLARTDSAQPLPFAFGGEAQPIDYARAIADGALLALIATLGLLQLGHETTPELAQLFGAALFLYGLAASPYRREKSQAAILSSLPILAASGAPSMAMGLAAAGALICSRSRYSEARRSVMWIVISAVLAAALASGLDAWAWRVGGLNSPTAWGQLLRQWLWFLWPVWPLALWTLWRWRTFLTHRHIAVPLACALVSIAACAAMGGSDRALMLSTPAMAVLAAFALPTLQRSTAAAIDWFSVFFFTVCALAIWVIYIAIHTGIPAKPAANVAKLAPDFVAHFSLLPVVAAGLGSLAWLWLVKWRTGRNRHPLWKSMVLPAGGVALCWLLLMTLWLPVLDFARSYRPLIAGIGQHIPTTECIAAPTLARGHIAALEYFGRYQVDAGPLDQRLSCPYLLRTESRKQASPPLPGWTLVSRERRPADNNEVTAIYRRESTSEHPRQTPRN